MLESQIRQNVYKFIVFVFVGFFLLSCEKIPAEHQEIIDKYYDPDFVVIGHKDYSLERGRYLKYRLDHITDEEQRCVDEFTRAYHNKILASCYVTGAGKNVGGGVRISLDFLHLDYRSMRG
jgi:hypothetical protein